MNGNQKIHIDLLFKRAFEDFETEANPEMLENILGKRFDDAVKSSLDGFTPVPVTSVWENISEYLPSEFEHTLNSSFEGLEVTPPAAMWERISESLPSKLDHALSVFEDFEVVPPAAIWENISASIPSELDHALSTSFEDFEVAPPALMWSSIQSEMDVEENFDIKFQAAFDGFTPTPSSHILNNVLNREFDTDVRRSFMRHEAQPREAVWDKIKPFIRFGPVLRRHIPTLKRVAAVIAIMLMFTFLNNQYNQRIGSLVTERNTNSDKTSKTSPVEISGITSITPAKNNPEQPLSVPEEASAERTVSVVKQPVSRKVTKQSDEIEQAISQSSSADIESSRQTFNGSSLPPVFNGNESTVLSPQFPIFEENNHIDDLISSLPNVEMTKLASYNTNNIILPTPNIEELKLMDVSTALRGLGNEYAIQSKFIDTEADNDLAKMMLNYRGWYVSTSFSLYNSWILNDEVREALSDQNQLDYVVDLGNSLGLGAGYQFTPNFGIEIEIVKSRLSQSYRELTNLNVSNTTDARTNYLYLPLSFKYQTQRLNSMNRRVPMTASVVFGTHYGKLQKSELRSNRNIEPSATDSFIQQELGVFMGADYHLYINTNAHLTIGARAAAGTDFDYLLTPFAAGTPYNLQFGVRAALNYRFATRQYKWNHGIY